MAATSPRNIPSACRSYVPDDGVRLAARAFLGTFLPDTCFKKKPELSAIDARQPSPHDYQ